MKNMKNEFLKSSGLFASLATAGLFALTQSVNATNIAQYEFSGAVVTSTDTELNSTAANFIASGGGGFSGGGNAYIRSTDTTASEAAAIVDGDYFSFTVTPDAGYELDLTQLTLDTIHNATFGGSGEDTGATMKFFVRSSVDAFAANIGSTFTQVWNTTTSRTIDLSAATFSHLASATEFRIYIYDSGVDTDINGARLDNVVLVGEVVVPAPDSIIWSGVGVSNISASTAEAFATLGGTNAEVTLYWKQGSGAPQQHTGWEGTNNLPSGLIATGVVSRAMTGLDSDTLYSFIFYGINSSNQTEAWSGAGNLITPLSSDQTPAFTSAVAGDGFVTLGWNDIATHETAYLLQRSASGSGGLYSVIDTLAPDTASYLDNGLSVGTYHYRLAATNAADGSVTDFTACQTNATVSTAPAWIYLEMFSGSGDLNGADPDIRPGSETWTASLWQQDGTIAYLGDRADSAWLPFTPQSGRVYTLAATVDAVTTSVNSSGSWTALGFGNDSDTTTFFAPPNNTAPWVLYRATETPDQIVTWTGPGATGNESEGTVAGPITLSIVLDTTSTNWTAEWFEGPNSLRTHTYSPNPTITTVGFGRSNASNGPITTFSLVGSSTPAGTIIFVN